MVEILLSTNCHISKPEVYFSLAHIFNSCSLILLEMVEV